MTVADETKLAVLDTKMDNLIEKINNMDTKVSTHYVSREEFEPIKKIVYGLVGLILTGVVTAALGLVLTR